MKASESPTLGLLAWLAFSILIVVLGAGFAGGFVKLLTIPWGLDAASLLMWAVTWGMVLAPIVLLGQRLISRLLKRSMP